MFKYSLQLTPVKVWSKIFQAAKPLFSAHVVFQRYQSGRARLTLKTIKSGNISVKKANHENDKNPS